MSVKVAINGFGRIGRLAYRAMVEQGLVGNDKNSQKELDKAIKHLEKSLHDDNWIDGDPTRLQEKKGKKVFDEDKSAVKSLLKIIEGKGKPLIPLSPVMRQM